MQLALILVATAIVAAIIWFFPERYVSTRSKEVGFGIIVVVVAGISLIRNIGAPLGNSFGNEENAVANVEENSTTADMNATAGMNAIEANMTEDATANVIEVGSNASQEFTEPEHDPNEVIFCDVLRYRATRAHCERLQEAVARLQPGAGGVDEPDTVEVGETATISFAISANPKEAPVRVFLSKEPKQKVEFRIGRFMAAELRGDGFKIEPVGLQDRDLFTGQGTRWDWSVTALNAPHHRLLLSAYVVMPDLDNTGKPTLLQTLELPLKVYVTWGQWFDDFIAVSTARIKATTEWFTALRGLVVAIGLFLTVIGVRALIRRFRRKKRA